MDEWAIQLQRGRSEAAWDLLLDRYRRLIFAGIRHYARDHDDVMDIFAHVCEALREDDMQRLRSYLAQPLHRASFSTWLTAVVRHLAVDWFRHRDGRRRLSAIAERLPPIRRRIFELVFLDGRSHVEAYELMRSGEELELAFGPFLREVAATYRIMAGRRGGALVRDLAGAPPLDLPEPAIDPPSDSDAKEVLAGMLDGLPPEERAAVQMYVVDALPAADVARILGFANAKAVYNCVYRALAALREALEREGIRRQDL